MVWLDGVESALTALGAMAFLFWFVGLYRRTRRVTPFVLAPLLAAGLSACDPGAPEGDAGPPVALGVCGPVDPASGVEVHDSADVRIVENLSAAEDEEFRLAEEPGAVIGGNEDDPDEVIGRLADAVLLSDGRIVIADDLAMQVRVHAPDGELLGRFGGPGEGPEEFSRSLALHRGPGDTLVVAHESGLRYQRVLPDGTFLDGGYVTAAPGEAPTVHSLYGVFPDGAFLALERGASPASAPATEVRRLEHRVQRLNPSTDEMGPPITVPREDFFTYVHEGEFEGFLTFGPLPFGRVESWALGTSEFYLGRGDAFEVERWGPSGELTGLFRICEEPEPVDPEEMERVIEGIAEQYDEPAATRERTAMRGVSLPTTEPAHLEMLADAAGRLWVRDFKPDWEDPIWRIFDASGRWIGSMTVPAGHRILDVGRDRLLLLAESELGVETVEVRAF